LSGIWSLSTVEVDIGHRARDRRRTLTFRPADHRGSLIHRRYGGQR
jgi:hypothetical protein